MSLSEKRIVKIVSVLQRLYLSFSIIIILIFLLAILQATPREGIFTFIIGIVLSLSLYFGLKTRQPWIVPVMIVLAILGILGQLFTSAEHIVLLLIKVAVLLLNLFELYFFTRKEVKKYFKVKKTFLFGL